MGFKELNTRPNIEQNKKLTNKYVYFGKLIDELKKREMPSEIVKSVNQDIEDINSFSGSNKDLQKQIRKSQSKILKLIEKELKLVPKNLYRSRWMALGMSAFGIPFGVAFGVSLDNMAFEEGRQIDLEIKY
ncbi:MAG: hypothetical protein QM503_04915 [Bacteroidota bacterium]